MSIDALGNGGIIRALDGRFVERSDLALGGMGADGRPQLQRVVLCPAGLFDGVALWKF